MRENKNKNFQLIFILHLFEIEKNQLIGLNFPERFKNDQHSKIQTQIPGKIVRKMY
jgi:hypothetical protein